MALRNTQILLGGKYDFKTSDNYWLSSYKLYTNYLSNITTTYNNGLKLAISSTYYHIATIYNYLILLVLYNITIGIAIALSI